ncbi:hypothetical protein Cfor_07782 [Coptotermes formosanus]|uniref:Mitochondrial-processing peptidase subunit alpha n=1 Tax=Coptotermes formosanus TaxID=36987 RepID=A0A6L2PHV2_COPFO|nr:hypothetical protein Cfor_07782 [Coptotermes formosanus]
MLFYIYTSNIALRDAPFPNRLPKNFLHVPYSNYIPQPRWQCKQCVIVSSTHGRGRPRNVRKGKCVGNIESLSKWTENGKSSYIGFVRNKIMVGRAGLHRIGANILRNQPGCSRGQTWQGWRKCSSTSPNPKSIQAPIENKSSTQPPLTHPLPGLPTPVYATLKDEHHITQITTLKNGLQVASENRFGQFCTVGVVIDSGSRYEVAYPSGISHFLEKLAFNSTTEFPDKDKILLELEKHGGICDCQSSRDTFIYASSADRRGMDSVVRVLGEVVLRPQISLKELAGARQALSFELETLYMRPEQEPILMDMIHAAAYRDNTLGLPKICPEANLLTIDRSVLFTYLKHHYTPKRMVVAGVGVEHNALVESVQKYFVDMKPIWDEDPYLAVPTLDMQVDKSIAQYTGGIVQVRLLMHEGTELY